MKECTDLQRTTELPISASKLPSECGDIAVTLVVASPTTPLTRLTADEILLAHIVYVGMVWQDVSLLIELTLRLKRKGLRWATLNSKADWPMLLPDVDLRVQPKHAKSSTWTLDQRCA